MKMFDEFLSRASALRSEEQPFAMAIVVSYQPPVSGKPGDKAIILPDGSICGWIGGGCVQASVIREAVKAIEEGRPRLVRITPERDLESEEGIVNYTMTCHGGGTLVIYIEPVLRRPQILIVGRTLVAQTLSRLGKAIGYRISVVAAGADREKFCDADLVKEELDLLHVPTTRETFVVVSTQGEQDEEALEQALQTDTPYISFVASKVKARKVLDFLAAKGIPPDQVARIRAPAGIQIGSLSPEEIAVSILAEIIQVRKNRSAPVEKTEMLDNARRAAETIDPVCGMTVDESATRYLSEYRGKTYSFCCAACKQVFDKHPEAYADFPVGVGASGTET